MQNIIILISQSYKRACTFICENNLCHNDFYIVTNDEDSWNKVRGLKRGMVAIVDNGMEYSTPVDILKSRGCLFVTSISKFIYNQNEEKEN